MAPSQLLSTPSPQRSATGVGALHVCHALLWQSCCPRQAPKRLEFIHSRVWPSSQTVQSWEQLSRFSPSSHIPFVLQRGVSKDEEDEEDELGMLEVEELSSCNQCLAHIKPASTRAACRRLRVLVIAGADFGLRCASDFNFFIFAEYSGMNRPRRRSMFPARQARPWQTQSIDFDSKVMVSEAS